MVQWFSDFNDEQKNIVLKELLVSVIHLPKRVSSINKGKFIIVIFNKIQGQQLRLSLKFTHFYQNLKDVFPLCLNLSGAFLGIEQIKTSLLIRFT